MVFFLDFDEDNLINGEDIVEIVNRLTMKGLNDENDGEDLEEDEKKKVAEIVSQNQY